MKKFTTFVSCIMLLSMGCQLSAQGYESACNPCPPPCEPCPVVCNPCPAPCAPICGQECCTNYIDPAIVVGVGAAIAAIVLLTNNDPHNGHGHSH